MPSSRMPLELTFSATARPKSRNGLLMSSLNRRQLGLMFRLLLAGRARRLQDPRELEAGARLREAVFVRELGWVEPSATGMERDRYDATAVPFGVFAGEELLACGRLLRSSGPFMLEHDFKDMLEGKSLLKGDATVELSRFALVPDLRKTVVGVIVKLMLWYVMVRWCVENGVRYWYVVTCRPVFDRIGAKFQCEQVGQTWRFENGPPIVAFRLDLQASFEKLERNRSWEALVFRRLFRTRPQLALEAAPFTSCRSE